MVNSQGPILTSIRSFPVRSSRDRVIVRLNVEADHSADKVMQEEFWPHGITCRPWMSREALRKQRDDNHRPGTTRRTHDLPPRFKCSNKHAGFESRDSMWSKRYYDVNRSDSSAVESESVNID
ncbi:hypothetical protein DPMN_190004 [Dreissena polymorpha]|uniref:Uncharacterized protein n=1 Tax=Dreissena polymorpha TaxID=45954 RepID=A0A9D4DUK3_DREPO|nr:hypothetical protein DPMN_190004 [Dreissena polymorpha]